MKTFSRRPPFWMKYSVSRDSLRAQNPRWRPRTLAIGVVLPITAKKIRGLGRGSSGIKKDPKTWRREHKSNLNMSEIICNKNKNLLYTVKIMPKNYHLENTFLKNLKIACELLLHLVNKLGWKLKKVVTSVETLAIKIITQRKIPANFVSGRVCTSGKTVLSKRKINSSFWKDFELILAKILSTKRKKVSSFHINILSTQSWCRIWNTRKKSGRKTRICALFVEE